MSNQVIQDLAAIGFFSQEGREFQMTPPPEAEMDFTEAGQSMPVGGIAQSQNGWFVLLVMSALILLWFAGTILCFARLLLAGWRLYRLQVEAAEVSPRMRKRLDRIISQLGYQSEEIWIGASTRLATPALVGFFRARILFPNAVIQAASDQQLEGVLAHELAHWRRRDNLANLLQLTVVALFWFHPLVRMLDHIAYQSREEICDNFVLSMQDPLTYSETLLWVGGLRQRNNSFTANAEQQLVAGIVSDSWNLEQRIKDLIQHNREKTMRLSKLSVYGVRFVLLTAGLTLASMVIVPVSDPVIAQTTQSTADQDTQTQVRTPPQARTAYTLSETIMEAISEIQDLMTANGEQEEVIQNIEAAKAQLDTLYEAEFESANPFERSTILNFYTNYYLRIRDFPGALRIFEQLLTIEDLREDIRLRALRSLGQLYSAEEQWQSSIDAFENWRELAEEEDRVVYRGLSYAHYELEHWQLARDFWIQYLAMLDEEEIQRDDLAYLNGLHFTLEDFDAALELTKEMILKFNQQGDWDNLAAIHSSLDERDELEDLETELGSVLSISNGQPEIAFASVVPTDGDYLPLLAVAPQYPTRAAEEGIEGWVLLSFTVNAAGDVVESSVAVEDAEPSDIFNRVLRSALSIASSFNRA